jgi:sugar/nucleoside kinase (ribokinase family)
VIGSTVVDVLLGLPRIPLRGEDVNISSCEYRIGGCAYNVYKTLRLFDSPALLCSPVGTGVYGRMVRESLVNEGITPFVNVEEENGCCYCLVEGDGERTFLSHHGAEYLFSRSWMKDIDYAQVDSIFICGIEVEDPTGREIVDFVCEHPGPELFFAPGPRIMYIERERMKRLFARRPILHLNETEALAFAASVAGVSASLEAAAEILAAHTKNTVVITLGERGCYYFAPKETTAQSGFVPGFPVAVRNTVGAGDAHCGAIIACLKQGKSLEESCKIANKAGAAAVTA